MNGLNLTYRKYLLYKLRYLEPESNKSHDPDLFYLESVALNKLFFKKLAYQTKFYIASVRKLCSMNSVHHTGQRPNSSESTL